MYIGNKIRALRKLQKMSLSTLAEKTNIQIATLSRIEHLKMSGTLKSHIKIAEVLGVNLIDLYSDMAKTEDQIEAVPAELPPDVFTYNEQSSYDILTTNVMAKKMLPTLIKIEPSGTTSKEKNTLGTEKFIYVLTGKVNVLINKTSYPLNKGGSLYFNASSEHSYANPGKNLTKIICVTTPVAL